MKDYKKQKTVEEKVESPNTEKKKYIRPELTVYGSITEVTQNTTTGGGDDVVFAIISG